MTATPNLDKMIALGDEKQHIQDFIDWLCDTYLPERPYDYLPAYSGERQREAVMAAYFGIDLQEAERERMSILTDLRQTTHMRSVINRRKGKELHP